MSNSIIRKLHQAEAAVTMLLSMGVEISHIEIAGIRPRIWLHGKDEALRAQFSSGIHRINPVGYSGGRETIMAAPFQGCQLQWGVQQ